MSARNYNEDPSQKKPTESFADVVLEFFELREKGTALSPKDLEVLLGWEKNGIDPSLLILKMRALRSKCDRTEKDFPTTLAQLEKHLKKWALDEIALP